MGINRSIDALQEPLAHAARRFLSRCSEEHIPVVIIETNRTQAVQDAYYAQGRKPIETVNALRKKAGLYLIKERENIVVTKARVSNHTGGRALDICPEIAGKPGFPWWTAP
ncbi:MAG: M15 family metallopeptidase, partial [Treponema sp.]|nr:M15 family metallopeptidase [Treponema sp.]